MEINAFKEIVNVTENKWYDFSDLALICGYHLKMGGLDWKSSNDLVKLIFEMCEIGFIEYDEKDPTKIKVMSDWYEYKSA